ncbi:glutathione peroxidase [Plakobranchus ocellatus]|uniref:Glutathione peroxidase n=1 Tax=Plakobranchus ocellatus TaxID=259542 RepID=A0AAV4DVS0_9GAST|nr:glutathione peroxidase [Plakobranchus ocellatus]
MIYRVYRHLPVSKLSRSILSASSSHQSTTIGSCSSNSSAVIMAAGGEEWKKAQSIYEFSALDIDGNDVSLEKYRGKLQELHTKYAEKGLSILGFPCNQFGSQEPGTNEEIKKFAQERYGAQFDLFSKIEVNGKNAHPLYKYLKKEQGGTFGDFIKWNFSKFLVNKEGKPVKRYSPQTAPNDTERDFTKLL